MLLWWYCILLRDKTCFFYDLNNGTVHQDLNHRKKDLKIHQDSYTQKLPRPFSTVLLGAQPRDLRCLAKSPSLLSHRQSCKRTHVKRLSIWPWAVPIVWSGGAGWAAIIVTIVRLQCVWRSRHTAVWTDPNNCLCPFPPIHNQTLDSQLLSCLVIVNVKAQILGQSY